MIIDALKGTTPWFVSGAIDFIAERIQPEWRAFEWGAGGSTLWLAQRCARVLSVEHSRGWYDKTVTELASFGLVNVRISCVERGDGAEAQQYAAKIDCFPDRDFDLIFVDGRNRALCLEHALAKVKPGGLLVLDNSERAQYQDAMRQFDGWERHDFGPGNSEGWTTTVWVKPQ